MSSSPHPTTPSGRSNVGKSTILNVLLNLRYRPQLRAAVSPTPGETQTLNFYDAGLGLSVVDMPGYGFSFASAEKVDSWSALMVNYLRHRNGTAHGETRAPLKRLLLLLDARHGLKQVDIS
jgi:GTP-binding protein